MRQTAWTQVDLRSQEPAVLIVDDELSCRELLRLALRSGPWRLLFAADADQAMQVTRDHKPSLILLDIVMPGGLGWDVLRAIKTDPLTAHIKVVMLTGLVRTSPDVIAQALSADGYLTKPVRLQEVRDTVRRLLAH